MVFVVVAFYIFICSYDVLNFYNNKNLKKEMLVYLFLISISLIVNILLALKIPIDDPMIHIRRVLENLRGFLGGIL